MTSMLGFEIAIWPLDGLNESFGGVDIPYIFFTSLDIFAESILVLLNLLQL